MMKKLTALLLFGSLFQNIYAQFYQPVFPNISGQELLESLVSAYKPLVLLPQAQGRDTLFSKIYNHNDSLTCVYTGFTIWLDPSQDPTQAAFMNGGPDAINTEHTFPQSLGASGLAEGDLHHLYPSRMDVNADRGNSPFAEIPDNETESWYYLNQELSTIPTADINLYSERKGNLFEPREDHKGNVARAMFYFYTMYKEQADMANSSFFETQRGTLCAWHFLDPVDELEWNRTWLIAKYQDGKPNPFILDCTLPERTYCEEFGETCIVSASEEKEEPVFSAVQVTPNPVSDGATFTWLQTQPGNVRIEIFNSLGEKIESPLNEWNGAGEHHFFWQRKFDAPAGLAFYCLSFFCEDKTSFLSGKILMN